MKFRFFLFLLVLVSALACKTSQQISSIEASVLLNEGDAYGIDSSLIKFIEPYSKDLSLLMDELVIVASEELDKALPESPLTNCLTDMFLLFSQQMGIDIVGSPYPEIAYINYYSLRSSFPKGDITLGNLYKMFPFENEIVYLEVSGAKIKEFARITAQRGGDCVSGVRMQIKLDDTVGKLEVNNQKVDDNKTYWLVTSDYIANGGDNMTMFLNPLRRIDSGVKVRDAFIDFMRREHAEGRSLTGSLDGRISYE